MTGRDGGSLLATDASPSAITDATVSVIVEETDAQRLDREHDQLYQELRALITGVQVLFGFLLSVTFTTRFTDLSTTDRRIHLAVIGCAATALVLLLAPTAFHRRRQLHRRSGPLRTAAPDAPDPRPSWTWISRVFAPHWVGRSPSDCGVAGHPPEGDRIN